VREGGATAPEHTDKKKPEPEGRNQETSQEKRSVLGVDVHKGNLHSEKGSGRKSRSRWGCTKNKWCLHRFYFVLDKVGEGHQGEASG